MRIRPAHTTDAAAVNELVTAAELFATSRGCVRMEVTSADRRRGYLDQTGTSSRFLRDLDDTDRRESRAGGIARGRGQA